MTDPRLAELRRAYSKRGQSAANMENGSVTSRNDPFHFLRQNPSAAAASAPQATRFSSSTATAAPKPSNSLLGRPPLKHRLTMNTIAPSVSQSEDDTTERASPASALTTPTSNGGTPPSTMGAGMRPVNLTNMSPQHTAFSQLTTSPDAIRQQQHPNRRMTTDSTATTSRFSQTLLTQLQSQLRVTQSDLQAARDDKRQSEQQYKQKVSDLQKQLQELQSQVGTTQAMAAKQSQLEQFQIELDAKAQDLQQQEQAHLERKTEDWESLQTTIAELEATQVHEEERLQEWADELESKQTAVEQAQQSLQHQRQAQDDLLQQEANKLDSIRKNFIGWEQRLQEQAAAIETRKEALVRQDELNRSTLQQIDMERAEIESAVHELDIKSSSAEARFQLVEQAVQEAIQKRQEEEIKLADAVNKRKQVMAQAQTIMNDSQRVKESLELKIRSAEEDYAALQDEVDEKTVELEALEERLKTSMAEDSQQQERANQRLQEVDRQVERILEQIEVAKREKESLSKAIACQQDQYDELVRSLRQREDDSNQRHMVLLRQEESKMKEIREEIEIKQSALTEAERNLIQTRLDAEAEAKRIFDQASRKATTMTNVASETIEVAYVNLSEKSAQLESLQRKLEQAAQKYESDAANLKLEKAICDDLTNSLNEKIATFAVSEGREKRMREELEWEVERLSGLLRSEREATRKRIEAADDDLEIARERHREQLQSVSALLDETEMARKSLREELDTLKNTYERESAKSDARQTSIITATETLQAQLDSATNTLRLSEESVNLLSRDNKLLMSRLEEAEKQLDCQISETEQLKLALARSNDDRDKMEGLMKSLEAHYERAEGKEADLTLAKERARKLVDEYEVRLATLRKEEDELSIARVDILAARESIASEKKEFDFERKKQALVRIFSRPIRQEQEYVSAAFSKWVRCTLFDMAEEGRQESENERILDLIAQLKEAQQTNQQLKEAMSTLSTKEHKLSDKVKSLEAELAASSAAESKVRLDLTMVHDDLLDVRNSLKMLEEEKLDLLAELEATKKRLPTEATNGNGTCHDMEERLGRMESLIAAREAELREKDASIVERESNLKLKERQFAAHYDDADSRMKETFDSLRQKEVDLEFKETHLASDLAKCKDTQTRLQKLALNVQVKAQQLSQDQGALAARMKECDELESQLMEWQKRLESFKPNGLANKK